MIRHVTSLNDIAQLRQMTFYEDFHNYLNERYEQDYLYTSSTESIEESI